MSRDALIHRAVLTHLTDKSVQLYRSSTLLSHGHQSVMMTAEDSITDHTRAEQSTRQSWEDESLVRQGQSCALLRSHLWVLRGSIADSSLPGVRQMVHTRRVGEDNNTDRMSLWLQNVESEEFLQSFVD